MCGNWQRANWTRLRIDKHSENVVTSSHISFFCFHRHWPKNFMKSEKFSPVNFPFPLNSCQSKFPLDSGESVIPSAQSKNIIPKHRNAIQTGNFLHIHSGKWLTTSASECRADSMVWQAAADELEALARVNNPFHHDVMWWDMKNGSEVSAMSLRGGSNESQSLKFAHNFSFHFFSVFRTVHSWPAECGRLFQGD